MFYLVRHSGTKEALGIMSAVLVIGGDPSGYPIDYTIALRAAVYRHVPCKLWTVDSISQAEYETYRDLHELEVFK